jgi:methionine--tRNA ligase beta chain
MISLDEFKRANLRVGEIVSAEAITGTSRLLQVQVDIGDERRTLVAGVAQHYAPIQLLGLKVIVVTNLEPATIRGIVSQGMMLGANCHSGQEIALVTINRDVPNGTPVE